jgi:DNA-3-methyladenine glycosylase II
MSDDPVEHLMQVDAVLCKLIQKVGACRLKTRRRTPYEALVQAVVYQQLNGVAAGTILGRVKALFPGKRFPSPEDLLATDDQRLRAAGLSRAKVASVKDIATRTLDGWIPSTRAIRKMDEAQILERLTAVRGIGPWTVEMLLIFTLGHPDILPVTDFGVRKGFAITYGLGELPKPKELLEFGQRWRPYRSTAAWYFWRALELPSS